MDVLAGDRFLLPVPVSGDLRTEQEENGVSVEKRSGGFVQHVEKIQANIKRQRTKGQQHHFMLFTIAFAT